MTLYWLRPPLRPKLPCRSGWSLLVKKVTPAEGATAVEPAPPGDLVLARLRRGGGLVGFFRGDRGGFGGVAVAGVVAFSAVAGLTFLAGAFLAGVTLTTPLVRATAVTGVGGGSA